MGDFTTEQASPTNRLFFPFLSGLSLPVVPVTPPSSYELSHCVHSVIRRNILFPLVIYPAFVGSPSTQRVNSSRQLPGPSHLTHQRIFHFSLPPRLLFQCSPPRPFHLPSISWYLSPWHSIWDCSQSRYPFFCYCHISSCIVNY